MGKVILVFESRQAVARAFARALEAFKAGGVKIVIEGQMDVSTESVGKVNIDQNIGTVEPGAVNVGVKIGSLGK